MTNYIKRGNLFDVAPDDALVVHKTLPVGNYTITEDPYGNLYLQMIDGFTIPSRVYGNTTQNAERIYRTYKDRPGNTGVLLAGDKGSGKTMLAKGISLLAATEGVPTIVINKSWKGDKFNSMMQAITQPCIILVDEFEKTYDRSEQNEILTLMDGVYQTNKLFILTVNDTYGVSDYMKNRPGRIFYYLDFEGLDADFIAEYCNENLNETKYTEQICNMAPAFKSFNFDMLKAIVEEMNRYNESPEEVCKMLNVRVSDNERSLYTVHLNVDGEDIDPKEIDGGGAAGEVSLSPFTPFTLYYYKKINTKDDDDYNHIGVPFTPKHLVKGDGQTGRFTFFNKELNAKLTVSKAVRERYSLWDAL